MKTKRLLLGFFGLVALALLAGAAFRGVNDRDYNVLRAISSTDDTGPAATDANATAADVLIAAGTAKMIYRGIGSTRDQSRGTVLITFSLTDATDEIANWALYGIKMDSSPLEFVAYGTATAGATETDDGGSTFFADEIAITQQAWNKSVSVIDGHQHNLGTGDIASGGIAKLKLDSCEYKYLYMIMSKSTCATMGAKFATYF